MTVLNHKPQIGQDLLFISTCRRLGEVNERLQKENATEMSLTEACLMFEWMATHGAEQLWATIFITKHFNVEWQVWRQEKESHSHWHWYTPTMIIIIKTTSNKQYSHLLLHAPWEIGLWTLIFTFSIRFLCRSINVFDIKLPHHVLREIWLG